MRKDLDLLSDAELEKIAGSGSSGLESMSDDELKAIAGDEFKEPVYDGPEVSPLGIGERARLGWGNKPGITDYLTKQKKSSEYKDDGLYVGGQKADPDNTRGWMEYTAPGAMYYQAKDFLSGKNNLKEKLNAVYSAQRDLPSDLAESPSSLVNYATTTAGQLTGSLLPVVGTVAGGTAGGVASEKAKEAIGRGLGVYKTNGEYFTPESQQTGKEGFLSSLLPAALEVKDVARGLYKKYQPDLGNLSKQVRGSLESIPGVGGFMKAGRVTEEKALREGFDKAEDLRRASYDSGVAELDNQFLTQESGRKAVYNKEAQAAQDAFEQAETLRKAGHESGAAGLKGDFVNQEAKRKAEYLAERKAASEAAKSAQSNAASKSYGGIVEPIEEKFAAETVSGQPVREKINTVLSKKGFLDDQGNILDNKIGELSAPEVRDFYSQLSSISKRMQKNPTIADLKVIKEELSALRSKSKFSPEQVRQFDEMQRGVSESYDNLIENFAGAEGSAAIKGAKSAYRSEKTLNDIIEEGTTGKRLTKAIEERGREKLKEILTPDQYETLMNVERRMIGAEKPFQRSLPPEAIPFQRGSKPDVEPFQRAMKPSVIPFEKGQAPEWEPKNIKQILSYLTELLTREGPTKGQKAAFNILNQSAVKSLTGNQ